MGALLSSPRTCRQGGSFFLNLLFLFSWIFLLGLSASGCKEKPPPPPDPSLGPAVVIRNQQGQVWTVKVELARTRQEHARGLMWRWSLPPDQGMLFIFPRCEHHSFWMKNTRIPLDMIFIGCDQKIAGIVENAEPYSTTLRSVSAPSRWVLEVNGGQARAHGLKPGDKVYFFHFEGAGP